MSAESTSHGSPAQPDGVHAGGHGHDHGHSHDHGHGDDHIHPAPSTFLTKYVFSTDHKVIGIQFLFSGLIFMVFGGLLGDGRALATGLAVEAGADFLPLALVGPVARLSDAAGVL